MGYMKRWFEDHVHEMSDEQLLSYGFDQEDIDNFREAYPGPKEENP